VKPMRLAALAACFLLPWLAGGATAPGTPARHFAANANFDASGRFIPLDAGFNLADVSTRKRLDELPSGVLGLVWIGRCAGADAAFKAEIEKFTEDPKLFGFYLMDDPDPTGRWRRLCTVENLRAEADWIHFKTPQARTFIALMNIGNSRSPAFSGQYAPERSHVDLFSIAPYPCRVSAGPCDFDMIGRFVRAAEAAGFPIRKIVPTYQTFGAGRWRPSDGAGDYRLPNVSEMEAILQTWRSLVQAPEMDFAYSWGRQRDDEALASAPALQQVFVRHNQR
jgi:hypothetical protein